MSQAAKEAQIWLVAGTIPLKADDDQHFIDACIVYNPSGEVAARYDKIHLFQFERGDEHYEEAQTTQAGSEVKTVAIETWEGAWKVGLSVCFDLRFPELFRKLDTPDIITLPAAFTSFTGRAHWDPSYVPEPLKTNATCLPVLKAAITKTDVKPGGTAF